MIPATRPLSVHNHDRNLAGFVYVYPVLSRRAGGVSVGINLNTDNACNWHCAYCQVPGLKRGKAPPVDLALLERELRAFLTALAHGGWLTHNAPESMREIKDIAFSGNGEPTSAEAFPEAVALAIRLRDESGLNNVPVRLITNGSLMTRERVKAGVRLIGEAGGEAWFKVDAGDASDIARINGVRTRPQTIARNLRICAGLCRTWVQTCLFRWDGAAPEERMLDAWLALLDAAAPAQLAGVLLYGIARPSRQPEARHLYPLTTQELEEIARYISTKKGLTVLVSP